MSDITVPQNRRYRWVRTRCTSCFWAGPDFANLFWQVKTGKRPADWSIYLRMDPKSCDALTGVVQAEHRILTLTPGVEKRISHTGFCVSARSLTYEFHIIRFSAFFLNTCLPPSEAGFWKVSNLTPPKTSPKAFLKLPFRIKNNTTVRIFNQKHSSTPQS